MIIDWLPGMWATTDEEARFMLQEAYRCAELGDGEKNGAVIVAPHGGPILATGYNHIPDYLKIALSLPTDKNKLIVHAEKNAIYFAAKNGISLLNSTMYCPKYACIDCAKAIISSGIKRVVGDKFMFDTLTESQRDTIKQSISLLVEAGVVCEVFCD